MAPLQGNQFLQLDPDQKRRASSRVTDPLSHLALLDASSPKGGAFCHLPVRTDKAPPFGGAGIEQSEMTERVSLPGGSWHGAFLLWVKLQKLVSMAAGPLLLQKP